MTLHGQYPSGHLGCRANRVSSAASVEATPAELLVVWTLAVSGSIVTVLICQDILGLLLVTAVIRRVPRWLVQPVPEER